MYINSEYHSEWLARDLLCILRKIPGSAEREQIISILENSIKIKVSKNLSYALAKTVFENPSTIEKHLDVLLDQYIEQDRKSSIGNIIRLLGQNSLWIEYPHEDRILSRASTHFDSSPQESPPKIVGSLISRSPTDPEHVVIFVAWLKPDGTTHHSYAILHWFGKNFRLAASSPDISNISGSPDRLSSIVSTSIPEGLAAEMEIWQELSDGQNSPQFSRASSLTMQHVLGESVFLMSFLMMAEADKIFFSNEMEITYDSNTLLADLRPPSKYFLINYIKSKLMPSYNCGFFLQRYTNRLRWSKIL